MNLKNINETFAKVFENPDRVNFRNLLKDLTGEYDDLDFKEQMIDSDKLAKHILSMANTDGGMIVFGVSETNTGLEPTGLDEIEDITDIKNKLNKYLPHELKYEICPINYNNCVEWEKLRNRSFLMIIIEFTPEYIPFLPLKESKLFKRTSILCRKNSSSKECEYYELKDLLNKRILTNTSTSLSSRDLDDLELLQNYRMVSPFVPDYQRLYEKKLKIILNKIK